MKKIKLILILSTIFFVACSESDPIKESIEKSLLENLNDASSYEFINLKEVNTITAKEVFDFHSNFSYKENSEELESKFQNCVNEKNVDFEKVVVTVYELNYRANNQLGNKVKNTIYFSLDNNLKILEASEKNSKYLFYEPINDCKKEVLEMN